MALMIALTALAIDSMLPALPEIGRDLNVSGANDAQLIIGLIFLGTAIGQMFYGPLSDSVGRKPTVLLGITIFVVGSLLCIFASEFKWMLWGRLLQGIGLGAPRVISTAIIRDMYEGREMARVMSFVLSTFILVPVIAPALGQLILFVASWRMIFVMLLLMSLVLLGWFMLRQPETLPAQKRTKFSFAGLISSIKEILRNPVALGYTVAAGLVSGPFVAFLSSIQQILQQQYALGTLFPLVFAGLAIAIGGASLVNARLVIRIGMRSMSRRALAVMCITALSYGVVAFYFEGQPPLWSFMLYLATTLFCVGILFANLSSLAMEPLGHIAGVGAALTSSLSTFISVPLGVFIGLSYNGTVMPLVAGFGVCGLATILIQSWSESRVLQQ
jgi:DHA1 family bicyclomycin/chloramphenicol resistance-like MFS transporter